MAGRAAKEPHTVFHRPALRIAGTEIKPADAREGHRGGAHGAGLQRDIEIAVGKPLRAERGRGLPDRQQLGVRCGIADRQSCGCPRARSPRRRARSRSRPAPRRARRGAGFVEGKLHETRHARIVSRTLLSGRNLIAAISMSDKNNQQNPGERIAKVMARAGLASRRQAEAWIAAGRVAVNGAVISSPALNVTAADRIAVDGQPLPRTRAHAAVPLPQAARAGDHEFRSGGAADHLRRAAQGPAAAGQHRPARHQHRRAAAAHQ